MEASRERRVMSDAEIVQPEFVRKREVWVGPQMYRVARLFSQGRTYREIAKKLHIKPATVGTYLHLVYCGLPERFHSRAGLRLYFKEELMGVGRRRGYSS